MIVCVIRCFKVWGNKWCFIKKSFLTQFWLKNEKLFDLFHVLRNKRFKIDVWLEIGCKYFVKDKFRAHLDDRFIAGISPEKCRLFHFFGMQPSALFTWKVERLCGNQELIFRKWRYLRSCRPEKQSSNRASSLLKFERYSNDGHYGTLVSMLSKYKIWRRLIYKIHITREVL